MDLIVLAKAAVMGIVEGLTEFLPISSTGHLILAGALLGMDDAKAKVFDIAIQTGAILAVIIVYWQKIRDTLVALPQEEQAQRFALNVAVAFFPAVVLGLLFAVIVLSLGGVKRSLQSAVHEAEGKGPLPDASGWQRFKAWAWDHKVFMSFVGLFLTVWVILNLWDAAWVIGVYGGDEVPHYKPEQPILFNHTLHAGKADKGNLAINCQYCHSSAEKSKHAGIPSVNVCMNCHKAVSTGRTEAGGAEIQKIYKHAGWDATAGKYTGKEEPVRWVKVHNLPDHAFFNHGSHVAIGKIECQTCHGPIDEQMDVAEQWAPLTMGWCIDCHNKTEVKMAGNGYYDEVMARLNNDEKLGHRELQQYLEDGKITVKELGGWECAKCHY